MTYNNIIFIYPIIAILFVHWIADFVLQKRIWAENKSKSIVSLSKHCITYSLCLVPLAFSFGFIWWVINSISHFTIDFFTSKCTSKLYSKGNYHAFFEVIGFDQFLHIVILLYPFIILIK